MRPRILLIHGYLSNPEAWAPLQRELAGEAETFAPVLPGYGAASDPSDYTLRGVVEALDDAAEAFQPDYALGHSMGALIALGLAARRRDRFSRVGLIGLPVFSDIEEGLRFISGSSVARGGYLRNRERGHRLCRLAHPARSLWAPALHLFKPDYPLPMIVDLFDHTPAAHRGGLETIVFCGQAPWLAAQVSAPVVALHGDRDRVTPLDPVVALARERGWSLRVARGAGHEAPFTRPRGVARWVRERLLAPVEARGAASG